MNLFDLTNDVVVVIGATGALGGAMAEGLAAAGAKVAVVGRNAGSNGVVTITGVGSALNASLNVGNNGTGTLTVQNGGSVSGAAPSSASRSPGSRSGFCSISASTNALNSRLESCSILIACCSCGVITRAWLWRSSSR